MSNWKANGNAVHAMESATYGRCVAIAEGDSVEEKCQRAVLLAAAPGLLAMCEELRTALMVACQFAASYGYAEDFITAMQQAGVGEFIGTRSAEVVAQAKGEVTT